MSNEGLLESIERRLIWSKATPIASMPGHAYDCDGRIIAWAEYGEKTAYGWQIDHAYPNALGGSDHFTNKRPRHWFGNQQAGGILGGLVNALAARK